MADPTKRKRRSKKAGLPPGSLVYIGDKPSSKASISIIEYNAAEMTERPAVSIDDCLPCRDSTPVSWINIEGVYDTEAIGRIGAHFGIHPLVLEDILNTDKRPTCEEFEGYVFLTLKMLSKGSRGRTLIAEQVSLVFGPTWVISFQEGHEGDVFQAVRERIKGSKGRIRHSGSDYLAYALLDAIVDGYFAVLEEMGEEIEQIEQVLATSPADKILGEIYRAKRTSVFLRRAVWPVRDIAANLERMETPLIAPTTRLYLRDVYTHTIEVIEVLESHREMVAGMLEIYLSSVSNKLNKVMMVLTLVTTIFMPLSFIAGVYGMNFKYMPELELTYGYPLVVGVMVTIAAAMLVFFRRRGWL
ncbi:MAG: magnesium/cobalt transporter CorA [Pseudomonadota bacterium]|jgi:magnesium transporter